MAKITTSAKPFRQLNSPVLDSEKSGLPPYVRKAGSNPVSKQPGLFTAMAESRYAELVQNGKKNPEYLGSAMDMGKSCKCYFNPENRSVHIRGFYFGKARLSGPGEQLVITQDGKLYHNRQEIPPGHPSHKMIIDRVNRLNETMNKNPHRKGWEVNMAPLPWEPLASNHNNAGFAGVVGPWDHPLANPSFRLPGYP